MNNNQYGVVKPFERNRYLEDDERAKTALRKYFDSKDIWTCIRETYGADIKSLVRRDPDDVDSLYTIFHEVEVQKRWDEVWPSWWKIIHIPYRKKRLIGILPGRPLYFWSLNEHCTKAWCVDSEVVSKSKVKEVSNKVIDKGELFYKVPVSKCRYVEF